MKTMALWTIALAPILLAIVPAKAACDACVPETKVPSASLPGQYDYHLSCIEDESGDELLWDVTAPDDAAAVAIGVEKCGPHR